VKFDKDYAYMLAGLFVFFAGVTYDIRDRQIDIDLVKRANALCAPHQVIAAEYDSRLKQFFRGNSVLRVDCMSDNVNEPIIVEE
jgi:hypothetical protein